MTAAHASNATWANQLRAWCRQKEPLHSDERWGPVDLAPFGVVGHELSGDTSGRPVVTEVLRLDDARDAELWAARGIGFEDVVFQIEGGDVLDIPKHPNPDRYAGQRIFVV